MAVWLIRAGSSGEFEQKFIQENRVYLTWDELKQNLADLQQRSELLAVLEGLYKDSKPKRLINYVSQLWPFAHKMNVGDYVILPSKSQPVIYVGKINSDYQFNPAGPDPFFHWRQVNWMDEPIPRSHFSQDLLNSFGAFMTICRIQRNNAEQRILAMEANGWQAESTQQIIAPGNTEKEQDADDESANVDLEELAHNQIVQMIEAKFKGHHLTRLVRALLEAQGYTTWQSPEGSDGGVDILASDGPMGFGHQNICIEVKSGSELVDRPTVDKLLGAMSKFGANQCIFIAWGGFRRNVQKELAGSFFRIKLWSQQELLDQLFTHYEKLDESIKAELPLKRVWMVATVE
ncbi:restriction endonuclease [Zooshikella marina]|uniref:restriction endonuclease n=1 Tax=Zooshikella ganghwensis TaxID=202772 RepID=UPI001BAF0683|nr:restriction endonuclease [Zooshikella ganghwensis]MBU2706340.1 restriction endonuclease [Zooshikella ganghwensis]